MMNIDLLAADDSVRDLAVLVGRTRNVERDSGRVGAAA